MKKSFPATPYAQGPFEPWPHEGQIHDLVVKGQIPDDLKGTYFRNGPNPQYVLNEKHHIFDGDGMIHAFEFSARNIRYYNKWVRTEKLLLERAAGRSLFGGMTNRWRDPSVQDRSGNLANTHVIWHGGKLLALFEAGFPIELDPQTLETRGPWDFHGELDRAMTAHPKTDPTTGDLLFYSYVFGASRELVFYRANKAGEIIETRKIPTPYPSMIHDFAITKNYVIFPLFPLTISMERAAKGLFPIVWDPALGTRFGLIPRDGSEGIQWIQTDACFAFHFMNAYEDEHQNIILDAMVIDEIPDDATPFQGQVDHYPTRLSRWTLNLPSKSAVKETLDLTCGEMPRMDERYCGLRYRHGYFVGQTGKAPLPELWNAVIHFDFKTKTRKMFRVFGDDLVNEAIFVPKERGAEGEGYLLCLIYRSASKRSDLVILDSMNVDKGPIATVEIPHRIPVGFHGSWLPASSKR